jgi:hypothetical protein
VIDRTQEDKMSTGREISEVEMNWKELEKCQLVEKSLKQHQRWTEQNSLIMEVTVPSAGF